MNGLFVCCHSRDWFVNGAECALFSLRMNKQFMQSIKYVKHQLPIKEIHTVLFHIMLSGWCHLLVLKSS